MYIGSIQCYGIIYKITNLINGKVYIGQTTNKKGFKGRYSRQGNGIERVYKYHMAFKNQKSTYNVLLDDISLYGFNAFSVVETYDIAFSKYELDLKEKIYIAKYNNYTDTYYNTYNSLPGGAQGTLYSDTCTICGRLEVKALGMCKRHYEQYRLLGKTQDSISRTIYDSNHYIKHNTYYEILTYDKHSIQNGSFIIDLKDFTKVIQYKWCMTSKPYCRELGLTLESFLYPSVPIQYIDNNVCNLLKSNICSISEYKKSLKGGKGVRYRRDRDKYQAYIHKDNKQISLGTFATEEEALEARRKYLENL